MYTFELIIKRTLFYNYQNVSFYRMISQRLTLIRNAVKAPDPREGESALVSFDETLNMSTQGITFKV